jgi:hypothetical protein
VLCHLKLITDVVFCNDCSKELDIVGFSCTERMCKLFCFSVLLGSFLLASMVSNVQLDK